MMLASSKRLMLSTHSMMGMVAILQCCKRAPSRRKILSEGAHLIGAHRVSRMIKYSRAGSSGFPRTCNQPMDLATRPPAPQRHYFSYTNDHSNRLEPGRYPSRVRYATMIIVIIIIIIITHHPSFNKLLKPTTSLFSLPFSFLSFATSSCASRSLLLVSSTPSPFLTLPSIFPNSSLKRSYNASFSALASRYNSSSFRVFFSLTKSDDSMSEESEDSDVV